MLSSDRWPPAAVLCCAVAFGGVLVDVLPAAGEDFRVENKVFVGSAKKAYSRSTTVFHEGVVYDYLDDPAEVIVLEKAAGRFVLLDTTRRVRAELATDDVAEFTQRLRESAGKHADPFVNFLAVPKFHEHFDKDAKELTLSSSWMTYRLLLASPGSPAIVSQYREFADWYARLNTLLHSGSRPPFARLLVNEAIQRYKSVAREVHLTMPVMQTSPPTRTTIRSEHKLIRQVAQADLDRVTQTRQFMEIFKPLSFEQYRKAHDR